MTVDSFPVYSMHTVPPPSGLYHHVLDTQGTDIPRTLWYLVGVFWDYFVSWSFEFLFSFTLYLSFVLWLVIQVHILCFESRHYCLLILHDVLTFHLVILLFSWVCVYVLFLYFIIIIVSYHAFYVLLSWVALCVALFCLLHVFVLESWTILVSWRDRTHYSYYSLWDDGGFDTEDWAYFVRVSILIEKSSRSSDAFIATF